MLVTDLLLLDYKRCQRRAYLNLHGDPAEREPEREFLLKLRQESQRHIQSVLQTDYPHFQKPPTSKAHWQEHAQATLGLMEQGAPVIYGGCLSQTLGQVANSGEVITLVGFPHLLVRQQGSSIWGDWHYRPLSIHLGRRPKPEYKILAAFYAHLLAHCQGHIPQPVEIILRRGNSYVVDLEEWLPRFYSTLSDYLETSCQGEEPEVFISRQRCHLCHWHHHCYGIAQSQKHLSLVPGVTQSRYESLQALGVKTIPELAQIPPEKIETLIGTAIATQLRTQAQSLVENRAIFKGKSPRPMPQASVELYFDIEAEPERNLDYLLGVMVVDREQRQEKFYGFLAESPQEEGRIWQEFLALVNTYPTAPIYHFSEYEVETIKRLAQLYPITAQERSRLLKQCFDLHHLVTNQVICPVENYSLKSLAYWLGFQWRDSSASGDQSVCWYDQWLTTGDRRYLERILQYNEDDCRATWVLKEWLTEFLTAA